MPRRDPAARRDYERDYMRKRRSDPNWRAPREPVSLEDRFWARAEKTDSCWLWVGSLDRYGYGRFNPSRAEAWSAHRYAYTLLVGPIPEGQQLDYLCRVRRCVRPSHLEPVSSRENTMRGQTPAAINLAKTHCPQNHEYTPENTRVSGGRRNCRACHRELVRRRRLEASS